MGQSANAAPSRAAVALSHPDFLRYQAARLCSTLGFQVLTVAIGWHVYDVSESPLHLGYIGLAQFLPSLLLAMVGGHIADRLDRRRIVITVIALQLGCAALLVAGVTAMPGRLHFVYAVAALLGACRAFLGPAMNALMPRLVPEAHFANAVAWHLVTFQLGLSLGPAVGGVAYGATGAVGAFSCSAALFFVSLVAATLIVTRVPPQAEAGPRWTVFLAGLRYVRERRLLLGAMSLDLFAVLLGGAVALLPIYARDILHVGPWGLGLLRAAPAVGASVMALHFARRPVERGLGRVIFSGVSVFGVAIVVFGVSRSFSLSLAALFVAGAADMASLTVRHSIIQLGTPDAMRGRVSAVASIFIGASNELGEMRAGLMAAMVGTIPAVVAGGVGACVVTAIWMRLFPDLRRLDELAAVRPRSVA
jgi:MFS family permease